MTLPPVIRIFFAIDLPESTKEKIKGVISVLKKTSRANGSPWGIRWTKSDNLHITLQFLAEVHAEHLPLLIANVRSKIKNASKGLSFTFGALHLFPDPYRPRVIVLDVTPQEDFAELSRLIGEGIQATSYEIESRPFRAHLTLGRIKQPQSMKLSFLSECEMPPFENINVGDIAVFRSEPQPEGSQYTVIERIALDVQEAG